MILHTFPMKRLRSEHWRPTNLDFTASIKDLLGRGVNGYAIPFIRNYLRKVEILSNHLEYKMKFNSKMGMKIGFYDIFLETRGQS